MADPLPPTPFAAKLAAELSALHEKREREPLDAHEEARYAELWAWWQARGSAEEGAAEPPEEGAESSAAADVPEEWLAAFAEPQPDGAAVDATGGAATQDEDGLVREWEAWQAQQPSGDPFARVPGMGLIDAPEPSEQEIMAARAEALAAGVGATDLGAPDDDASAPGDALLSEPTPTRDDVGSDPVSPPPATESAAAAAPLEAPPATASPPAAQQRVAIHLADGQVRRGFALQPTVEGDVFRYLSQAGAEESVPRAEVRAIFFMRAPGAPPPQPAGTAVRVTFRDGRELAGFSEDHDRISDAFTLVPSEARTNAALVWIARAAVRQVS